MKTLFLLGFALATALAFPACTTVEEQTTTTTTTEERMIRHPNSRTTIPE